MFSGGRLSTEVSHDGNALAESRGVSCLGILLLQVKQEKVRPHSLMPPGDVNGVTLATVKLRRALALP